MSDSIDPARRRVFKVVGAVGLGAAVPLRAPAAASPAAYRFFSAREAAFVEGAVARLIPSDELGPGALEAGVPNFIDEQLAGPWGAGERLYRGGPFRAGAATQGYQLPYTPAELFRRGLAQVDTEGFVQSGAARQDEVLRALEKESPEFFESLLALTIEGFFSDPMYGGNRGMVGWRLIGFPGAYANYYELVDEYGVTFTRPPMSLGQGMHHK